MAALINALDSTPKQFGQNGAVEYGWSNDIREQVLQFSGQIVRTDEAKIEIMADKLRHLLRCLSWNNSCNALSDAENKELMVVLYKLIALTRDIVDGKGEYALAYMQVFVWYEFYPALAMFALDKFVLMDNEHPYGSWKDMKYFCNYVRLKTKNENHPLIDYACNLIINQIIADQQSNNKALVGKWVPREKSHKFGWIFIILAGKFFHQYLSTATTHEQRVKAFTKCKMEFRKVCSALNKELDTVQIKQCAKVWSTIDHTKTTSITNSRQKKAFLNVTKAGKQRSEEDDRIACAENYKNRIQAATSGVGPEIKGKRVGLDDFAKEAMQLNEQSLYAKSNVNKFEKDALNSQWRDNSKQTGALGEMVAMVDTSGSMTGAGAIYPALSLGIRVAEKSKLGKRIITFSAEPTWHNLEGINDYTDCVRELHKASWGMNTNFMKAFDMILNAIIEKKLKPDEAKGFILAVFSDMQFDQARGGDMDTIYEVMTKKYADAGRKLHGEPYELPHLLFWNMTSGSGFPVLSTFKNTSFISGYNPSQLNLFCEKGLGFLSTMTPWSMLVQSIDKPRYKCMELKMMEFFGCLDYQ
jgi:Domain of unknown function (DUF2828)